MEATCSSETTVYNKPGRSHSTEDDILQFLRKFAADLQSMEMEMKVALMFSRYLHKMATLQLGLVFMKALYFVTQV
jgi:hypothetical protein